MELIRFEHVYKTYGQGEGQVHALAVRGDRERSDAAADSPYQHGRVAQGGRVGEDLGFSVGEDSESSVDDLYKM